MIKVDEHDETDLEYGNQRKAIMDMKEDVATVRCMVSHITAAILGTVFGAFMFLMYYMYSLYICKEGIIFFPGTDDVIINHT